MLWKEIHIKWFKNKLNQETYDLIDRRMSRKNIRFDKTTVDTVLKYIEEAENNNPPWKIRLQGGDLGNGKLFHIERFFEIFT